MTWLGIDFTLGVTIRGWRFETTASVSKERES